MTERGMSGPESVAPWHVGLINMACRRCRPAICAWRRTPTRRWTDAGMDCSTTIRHEARRRQSLARMELIGLPWQIVIGARIGERASSRV